ncbi:MAG TPA: glycosyltransferase family 1 protein [Myxococcaceae bacterium]|nr:glycosyltransferase family 1 protein [Myxococcaceae bacterium]
MASRVLIDLRMVTGRLHGIARYALELARVLPALAPDLVFEGLGPPGGLPELGPLAPTFPVHRAPAGFLSPLEQPALAAVLRRLEPDLFHATSFSVPLLWRGPLVATLHDAAHLARSEEFGWLTAVYYRVVVGPRVRRARGLLTVSEFARRELASRLGVPESRWSIVPPGVDPRFHPPTAEERLQARARLGLPARYLLAVGNPKPHKNLALLARIATRLPVPLVLLAGDGAGRVFPRPTRVLSEVEEAHLPALYGGAEALLLPSRHEGFGLPALEAMATGTPVLAANAGSLPEVTGGAAELLDPDAPEAWIAASNAIVATPLLRARWASAGRERARAFTWERCARHTLAVYRSALG